MLLEFPRAHPVSSMSLISKTKFSVISKNGCAPWYLHWSTVKFQLHVYPVWFDYPGRLDYRFDCYVECAEEFVSICTSMQVRNLLCKIVFSMSLDLFFLIKPIRSKKVQYCFSRLYVSFDLPIFMSRTIPTVTVNCTVNFVSN